MIRCISCNAKIIHISLSSQDSRVPGWKGDPEEGRLTEPDEVKFCPCCGAEEPFIEED